jgi:hypothetical protein
MRWDEQSTVPAHRKRPLLSLQTLEVCIESSSKRNAYTIFGRYEVSWTDRYVDSLATYETCQLIVPRRLSIRHAETLPRADIYPRRTGEYRNAV